jgi:predicted nucleotidyltransferase component of viral defense system
MIDKRDVLESASALKLLPNVIERDYVLGWILGGVNNHLELNSWAFKGGTCLKKCYFETYRFSEDLDFTLGLESHLDEAFLRRTLTEVCAWVTEQSGITLPFDQISIDIHPDQRGKLSCQVKIVSVRRSHL